MESLNEQEIHRYERQISLPEFGLQGQVALKNASILVVGLGGLGTPAAQYLAAAGVGRLGLVDGDVIEVHNLQRQILYTGEDVGRSKVNRAAERLRAMNAGVQVESYSVHVTGANVEELVSGYDLVLDGTDQIGARQVLNRTCAALRKPLVYGALSRSEGVVSVFCGPGEETPCYACLHGAGEPAPGVTADCNAGGVLGVLPGVIGVLQATEAIKVLARMGQTLQGRLLQYDALNMTTRQWTIPRDPACEVCGSGRRSPSHHTLTQTQTQTQTQTPTRNVAVEPGAAGGIVQITVQDLKRRMDQRRTGGAIEFRILDVREVHELQISKLPDVILIPVGQLADRLQELDPELEYAVLCKAGGRSQRAAEILAAAGFPKVLNVIGGINAYAREIDPEMPEY
ncbi:MAG: HesA/MoeB/ThiF family protein [Leptospirales bacterium]